MNHNLKQLLFLILGVIGIIVLIKLSGVIKGVSVTTFEQRLDREGAMDGDIRISLIWDNYNDIDLHLITPKGEQIYFGHKNSSDGGVLDVDMNVEYPDSAEPVENIVYPNGAPSGSYKVYVNYYRHHTGEVETPFSVNVKIDGESEVFDGVLSEVEETQLVYEFEYAREQ